MHTNFSRKVEKNVHVFGVEFFFCNSFGIRLFRLRMQNKISEKSLFYVSKCPEVCNIKKKCLRFKVKKLISKQNFFLLFCESQRYFQRKIEFPNVFEVSRQANLSRKIQKSHLSFFLYYLSKNGSQMKRTENFLQKRKFF